jgi:hypothetical protein
MASGINGILNSDSMTIFFYPQHLLLPKGSPDGTIFQFVVQISNFDDDIVDGPIDP